MKRFTKFASIFLAMILVLSAVFVLAACESAESKALKTLILPENETIVKADFTLPKTLGTGEDAYSLNWASDNEAAIKIEDGTESYTAKVTVQAEVTPVTLTASIGRDSRNFNVRVAGVDVYTFFDNYKFPQKNSSVTKDFDLAQSVTLFEKTAQISWTIDEAYAGYAKVSTDGKKCEIVSLPDDDSVEIEIKAKFTYNNKTAEKSYFFSVSPVYTHLQEVNRRYSVDGSAISMEGYIIHLNEASDSYKNATFWIIDKDFDTGYYLYRVGIDEGSASKFVEGAYVKVTGATAKNYNGLWENNSDGKAVVDESKPKLTNVREHLYNIDTELASGIDSAKWRESTFVKVNGWYVSDMAKSKPTGADADLFTITNNSQKVTVRISKYIKRTDAELKALCDVYDTVKAAKDAGKAYVDVTGLLGNFDGYQIQPVTADDVKLVSAEGTNNGKTLQKANDAVTKKVKSNFPGTVVADKEATMPVSSDNVTISYEVAGVTSGSTVTIDNTTGKFTIHPTTTRKNYDIQVTYTIGQDKYYSFFKLPNQKLDNEGIAKEVRLNLTIEAMDFVAERSIVLPATGKELGFPDVTITWAVKDADKTTWMKVEDGKLKVTQPSADSNGVLVATIKSGDATATRNFVITVTKKDFDKLTAPKAGEFVLSVLNKGVRLYATGLGTEGNNKGYLETSNDSSKAAKFTLVAVDGGYHIKLGDKFLELDAYVSSGKTYISSKLKLSDTASTVWTWREAEGIFVQTVTVDQYTDTFYIGMRDDADFTTISPSAIKYITDKNAANLDVTQHPARFGNYVG